MPSKREYAKHPESGKQHARMLFNRELIITIKEGTACADCGGYFPHYVMEFDHLDSKDKRGCVATLCSQETGPMLTEIAKCEVVCANCHNARTYFRP